MEVDKATQDKRYGLKKSFLFIEIYKKLIQSMGELIKQIWKAAADGVATCGLVSGRASLTQAGRPAGSAGSWCTSSVSRL